MKIALVYDRINKFGGAERVLSALHEMWPEAPIFTSVYDREGAPWAKSWDIRTSWLMNIPGAKTNHESFGWLMPLAFEPLDLSGFDVVISVTSEAAKGVITRPGQLHVCYLLTPTRYLWSHAADYLNQLPGAVRPLAMAVQSKLRVWDYLAGQRPDFIISISDLVKKRCEKYYRRRSEVIYPPMVFWGDDPCGDSGIIFSGDARQRDSNPDDGQLKTRSLKVRPIRGFDSKSSLDVTGSLFSRKNIPSSSLNYYVVVSRLVRYKRIDLAVEACNRLGVNLVIVGSGNDEPRLKSMAGPTIRFAGNLTDEELVGYYRRARALLMPQEEDFGLTAVEALSCGTPVISFRNSGAAEVIHDGKTGVLFGLQTAESLMEALGRFTNLDIQANLRSGVVKRIAQKYSKRKFQETFSHKITQLWLNH